MKKKYRVNRRRILLNIGRMDYLMGGNARMQTRVSRILLAIFEQRKPVLEVGSSGGFVLSYPGTEAQLTWRIYGEKQSNDVRDIVRNVFSLELPSLPIINVNMWYGGGASGMTIELIMEFFELISKYGICIVTSILINEKLILLFEKMGGIVESGRGILCVKNSRPVPIPQEWNISEPKKVNIIAHERRFPEEDQGFKIKDKRDWVR